MLLKAFRSVAGMVLEDDDGESHTIRLLPPATLAELGALEAGLPAPLPPEVRATLEVTTGLEDGPLDSFSLLGLAGYGSAWGLEELFPHPHSIAHDGYGNYWLLDLLPDSTSWGSVWYACHDPPVIVYQSPSIEDFLREMLQMWQPGPRSEIDRIHEEVTRSIWRTNPAALPQPDALTGTDPRLREFAGTLPSGATIFDLRSATVGSGFSWGMHGSKARWARCGDEWIWAAIPPERRRGLLGRLLG